MVGQQTAGLRFLLPGRADIVSSIGTSAFASRLFLGIGRRGRFHSAPHDADGRGRIGLLGRLGHRYRR